MKLGSIEGSPQEIKDLFENNGLKLENYIEKPKNNNIDTLWVLLPSVLLIIGLSTLYFMDPKLTKMIGFTQIVCIGLNIWLIISIQLRYNNVWATGFSIFGLCLMFMVTTKIISPKEAIERINKERDKITSPSSNT